MAPTSREVLVFQTLQLRLFSTYLVTLTEATFVLPKQTLTLTWAEATFVLPKQYLDILRQVLTSGEAHFPPPNVEQFRHSSPEIGRSVSFPELRTLHILFVTVPVFPSLALDEFVCC